VPTATDPGGREIYRPRRLARGARQAWRYRQGVPRPAGCRFVWEAVPRHLGPRGPGSPPPSVLIAWRRVGVGANGYAPSGPKDFPSSERHLHRGHLYAAIRATYCVPLPASVRYRTCSRISRCVKSYDQTLVAGLLLPAEAKRPEGAGH